MSSESTSGVEAKVRRLSRAIAIATHARTVDALEGPAVDVAQLAAGLDPDEVDPESSDFRFGATEAFSALLNALAEQMLSRSAIDLLRKRSRAQTLVAIAIEPGLPQKALSDRTGIAESNLSGYIRELAASGLLEPATPAGGAKGKAWRLSPWGSQTIPQVIDVLAPSVEDKLLQQALHAALGARNRPMPVLTGESASLIPKEEVYRRLELAATRDTDEMMYASTFYGGDLRDHANAWRLHQRVIAEARRPITWVILRDERTLPWVDEIVNQASGNKHFTILTLDEIAEMRSPVQVLDDDGLVYPIDRDDNGLVRPKDVAEDLWRGYGEGAKTVLIGGKRSHDK
jgi:DNA-binding MarR family transcriptional regulator